MMRVYEFKRNTAIKKIIASLKKAKEENRIVDIDKLVLVVKSTALKIDSVLQL